jgi:hypothetical protein
MTETGQAAGKTAQRLDIARKPAYDMNERPFVSLQEAVAPL